MPNSTSITTAYVNAFPHELLSNEKLLNNDSDFSIFSTDCCCGRSGCDNYQTWTHIVRKLENDARLAAGKERASLCYFWGLEETGMCPVLRK